MRVFGLTGGIGSGKSTVAEMLRELGAEVIDADVLAREVVAPGTQGLAEIVTTFGPGILRKDGALDRQRLARLIFADPENRRKLNSITHPRIAARAMEQTRELADKGHTLTFYEAALLVENGVHEALSGLIVVTAPESEQVRRVVARDGCTPVEARARIAAQLPLEAKVDVATDVIDNGGTVEETRSQTAALWRRLNEVEEGGE